MLGLARLLSLTPIVASSRRSCVVSGLIDRSRLESQRSRVILRVRLVPNDQLLDLLCRPQPSMDGLV